MFYIKLQKLDKVYYLLRTGDNVHDRSDTLEKASKYVSIEEAEQTCKELSLEKIYNSVEIIDHV